MNRHPVSLENLADWLDGRLDEQTRQAVEEHLARDCPTCQADVAWLRRVMVAARSDDTAEPPAAYVARVKGLYRARPSAPVREVRRPRLAWSPRWAMALSALLVLAIVLALYAFQTPTLFARQATLTDLPGVAEMRSAADATWQAVSQGTRLCEGEALRVTDGVAVLTLFDGSVLQLQAGAELGFSTLRSGLLGATRQIVLHQPSGSVAYDVVPLGSARSTFQAQSPTVLVTVRGTLFVLTVESEVETKVEVLEGRVEVANEVQTVILEEREVAAVPANAPVLRLPTLTPLPTPKVELTEPKPVVPSVTVQVPTAVPEAPPSIRTPEPFGTPVETATPLATATPQATETPSATVTSTLTPTLVAGEVDFVGVIERLPPNGMGLWLIGGRLVRVTARTEIIGRPAVGLQARVRALQHRMGPLEAIKIEIEELQPTQTLELPATPQLTWTPEPTGEPSPTPTATPQVTSSPIPTRTPRPTHTPKPPRTPGPTHTPHPPVTPEVQVVKFGGLIESFPRMRIGSWVIAGQTLLVTPYTQIVGTPEVGAWAEVEALRHPALATDAPLVATKIEVLTATATPATTPATSS